MNNFFAFKALLLEMGFKEVPDSTNTHSVKEKEFSVDSEPSEETMQGTVYDVGYTVTLGSGVGYGGFFTLFFFDKAGKFLTHGCWE